VDLTRLKVEIVHHLKSVTKKVGINSVLKAQENEFVMPVGTVLRKRPSKLKAHLCIASWYIIIIFNFIWLQTEMDQCI